MKKVLVVGGGAAGLMAAHTAAAGGASVTLLEKMPAIGRKLLITGKGRCNITNNCDLPTFIKNVPGNGQFLYSALNAFTNHDVMAFFEGLGVPVKQERGGRVFPVSDKARDVVDAFQRLLTADQVTVKTGEPVEKILNQEGRVTGVQTIKGHTYEADAVILATGGASYPGTGSSGDGYRMAKNLGHTIVPLKPSLVPLEVEEDWIGEVQGLALKNVSATVFYAGTKRVSDFGEMLFTHYGMSGPIILSLSNVVSELLQKKDHEEIFVEINLKPALTPEQLDKRLQRDFTKFARKQFKNSLNELLPSSLINPIIDLSYIDPDKPVNQITKEERLRLTNLLQHLAFAITGTRPLAEAIVTAGGVHTKEIHPGRMESKLIRGLFLAGEVIDVDAYTGGFNLQAAFSTGFIAGQAAAQEY
ncbi:MAG: hypothetical protein H6Q74_658 [Firmicutes bacterium]|nr:hypothetical protein [Bacillota bacterium]